MENVKHDGCSDCESKEEPILTSVKTGKGSQAFCSACLPKHQ
jgi:hypothetical protein